MLAWLLEHGADVHARDNDGNTCLHILVYCSNRPDISCERDSLMLLVAQGQKGPTGVHSVNSRGQSVSELAYTRNETDIMYKLGNYRGDLWDIVLAAFGYDVMAFRKRFPRVTRESGWPLHHIRALRRLGDIWVTAGFPEKVKIPRAIEIKRLFVPYKPDKDLRSRELRLEVPDWATEDEWSDEEIEDTHVKDVSDEGNPLRGEARRSRYFFPLIAHFFIFGQPHR